QRDRGTRYGGCPTPQHHQGPPLLDNSTESREEVSRMVTDPPKNPPKPQGPQGPRPADRS
ncbi:hypothetical protein, partial [Nocardiopsis tropica]|uniref:hypothetical protein n=1 Tax=Nocardiopsis tropica TaxID=109330 RepID=UPI003337843C